MGTINMTPIKPLEKPTQPAAPTDDSELKASEPVAQKTDSETAAAMPLKTAGAPKHVLTFVANGVWYDQKNEVWHRNHEIIPSTRTYDDEEYKTRGDLQFMVKYGSMKEQIV